MAERVVEVDLPVGADQPPILRDRHHSVVDARGIGRLEHAGDDRNAVLGCEALKLADELPAQRLGERHKALVGRTADHRRLGKQHHFGTYCNRALGELAYPS